MRNQRSWRLLTEIEPNDSSIQVSKVIWKVDTNWQPFYPLFTTPTTVVFMSDDKKIFETCKATADWLWNMTLTKRWLSDDATETEVNIFKKDWLPWTYMFTTMWAADATSVNDDNIWVWNQTFVWDLIVQWEFEISWDVNMQSGWDVAFKTTWDMTFQDQTVWPVTLSEMIHPALSGTEVLVMSESSYQHITPTSNTVYITTDNQWIVYVHVNGADYVAWNIWYNKFLWQTVSWSEITINNFSMDLTPTQNFTIKCGTVKEWMQYVLEIHTGATAYTMTLWTWITNPFGEKLELTANKMTSIIFLAKDSSNLEIYAIRTEE